MSRSHLLGVAAGVAAGLLMTPAAGLHQASAAQLHVTAAPIQTWKIVDGLPELPVPPVDLTVCGDLDDYDEVVYGTEDDDELTAGNGSQVLVGLGGDDVLVGGNQDDCLLGGAGNDRLLGENGKDLLFGGRGADELDGGTGHDLLDAGADEGDLCISSGAPDDLVGCPDPEVTELDSPATTATEASPQAGPDDVSGDGGDPKGGQPSAPKPPAGAETPTTGGGEEPEQGPPAAEPPAAGQPATPALDEAQVTGP